GKARLLAGSRRGGCGGGLGVFSAVFLLCDGDRGDAGGAGGACRRRPPPGRPDPRAYLHRHAPDGRRLPRHEDRRGRPQLGEGASRSVAAGTDSARRPAARPGRSAATMSRTGTDPKTAALLAAAAETAPEPPMIEMESAGVILVYGRDETAIEAGKLLSDHLDVTVLIEPPAVVPLQAPTDFPMARGRIRTITGHLGAFEVLVDDFALPAPSPSSPDMPSFGPSRDGAQSRADIVLDLSGRWPLLPAADLRDGYLRADPAG